MKKLVLSLLFKLIDKTVGLRVSPEEEMEGLDLAEHGGNAYPDFEVSSYGGVGGSAMGPGSPAATGDAIGQLSPSNRLKPLYSSLWQMPAGSSFSSRQAYLFYH